MIIRKYLVDDMNEAMFRIKYELGDEAYIISQKFVRRPGIKGFFGNKQLEVTVGLTNINNNNKYLPEKALNSVGESNFTEFSSEKFNSYGNGNKFQGGYSQKNFYNNNAEDLPQAPLMDSKNSSNEYINSEVKNNINDNEVNNTKLRSLSYYNQLFEEKQRSLNDLTSNPEKFSSEAIIKNEKLVQTTTDKFSDIMDKSENLSLDNNNYPLDNSSDIEQIELNLPFGDQVNKTDDNKEAEVLRKELDEVKNIVKELINTKVSVNFLDNILYKHDICKELSDEIKKNCPLSQEELLNERAVKKYLRSVFSKIVKVVNEEITGRVILVGPTGVGKTTTVAKLAGVLSINLQKKVGLVTIDTYRVGAIEQLRIYSDIMNIPYRVVNSLTDLKMAFDHMKSCDVVLIDTIGRSSRNLVQLSELKMFVETSQPDDTTLVVSAGIKQQDMDLFLDAFKQMKFKNIIVTKLDETESFGMLVNICYKTSLPISFVSVGQDVPVDIKRISEKEILDMILGEESL